MSNDKIIYQLEQNNRTEVTLKNAANEVLALLNTKFGNEYTVTASAFGAFEKDWSHSIKVRKGNKIGAEVDFKWEKSKPEIVTLEVSESSKMGSQITTVTLLVFLLTGAYLGYNKIAPLTFLPGYKIAAGLGGLIFLIPGLILVAILKKMLLNKEKEQNKQLVNEVIQVIKK